MAVRTVSWAFLFGLLAVPVVVGLDPPAAARAESLPIASDARLGGDESQTRFVLDLNRKIDFHAFTLAEPYRAVLDIPETTFQLPPKAGERGRGLIKAFRFGLVMRGGSRVVFDLARPARIEKAFMLDATDTAPARLVLEFLPTDRASFLRRIAEDTRLASTEVPTTPPPQPNGGDPRPLVALDPGHGGIDTGTKAPSGELEKDIVLDFSRRVRDWLLKSGKFRVMLTRSDDTFVPLAERVHMARNAGAALFVSIHADSLPRREGDAQGASVYTLSETASDTEAARLADSENRADVIAGVDLKSEPDDVADILIDLAQRETKGFSLQLAHKLISEMKGATRLHKMPLKSAGFRVLRAPDIPSVLIELGYVSNREDLHALISESWRNRTSEAIGNAIEAYLVGHAPGQRAGAN